jgi:hypothetical protein
LGPPGAPEVIEFTDPDCPYCRALDRFWATKAAEVKSVRRVIFFVSGIHPTAASKAEHILCAKDKEATFRAIYSGAAPSRLDQCPEGHAHLAAHDAAVKAVGLSGTPTLILGGKLLSGFQQAGLAQPKTGHSQCWQIARPAKSGVTQEFWRPSRPGRRQSTVMPTPPRHGPECRWRSLEWAVQQRHRPTAISIEAGRQMRDGPVQRR